MASDTAMNFLIKPFTTLNFPHMSKDRHSIDKLGADAEIRATYRGYHLVMFVEKIRKP